MTGWTLIRNSLRHHWRSHLGTFLGAAIGSAVLIGALIVGDSVRESLKEEALRRTGGNIAVLATGERVFPESLAQRLQQQSLADLNEKIWQLQGGSTNRSIPIMLESTDSVVDSAFLLLPGSVARQDGSARINHAQVFINAHHRLGHEMRAAANAGLPRKQWTPSVRWPGDTVFINAALARQLSVAQGDTLVVRVPKLSNLSKEAVVSTKEDQTVALRFAIGGIVTNVPMAGFAPHAGVGTPFNIFLPPSEALFRAGLMATNDSPANVLAVASLAHRETRETDFLATLFNKVAALFNARVRTSWDRRSEIAEGLQFSALTNALPRTLQPIDFQSELVRRDVPVPFLELRTSRVFLDPPVVAAASDGDLSEAFRRAFLDRVKWQGARGVVSNGMHWVVSPGTNTAALAWGKQAVIPAPTEVLTYLVNLLSVGTNQTPYSMVSAVGAPYTPADLKDDEIVVNQWLADDLKVGPGDSVSVSYFVADSGSQLIERTNTFRVRSVVPLAGLHADRTLMPDFPGVAKAESTKEWDAGFPLVHKIRDKDETYWNQHKGTPKAFITLAAGQQMWSNRWGDVTSVRWFFEEPTDLGLAGKGSVDAALEKGIASSVNPADVGLRFVPIREQALKGASEGQDFGGLFIGFSFFLIAAALILMSMLFQFGLEQRAPEIGTLLAVGWKPGKVRRLLLGEGLALAFLGGVAGVIGGAFYARAMIGGLNGRWNDAIGGATLGFYLTPKALGIGLAASVVVAGITLWLALRKQGRRPARELLAEGGVVEDFKVGQARCLSRAGKRPALPWLALVCIALALVAVGAAAMIPDKQAQGGAFFGGGSLLLIGGILLASWRMRRQVGRASSLTREGREHPNTSLPSDGPTVESSRSDSGDRLEACPTLSDLAARSIARRRKRSLATIALLASGSFLIVAVGANRLDANRDATKRSSGTGGFALIGESALPIVDDPNTERGRENLNLPERPLGGVSFVPLRVKDGDEASCLNLGRAQQPRLLGVNPDQMASRGAFTFTALAKGFTGTNGWLALATESWSAGVLEGPVTPSLQNSNAPSIPVVPAIGDANSIQWAMGKKVGDTLDYVDERGQPFKVRIVGAVANSILQGQLLIDEAAFKARFPSIAGYRMFLIDAPSETVTNASAALSRALQDFGLELTPTTTRLNQFNAVQNTYLGTFQILGGLGLLLGSAGLGVVVLRNVLERRTELAVMQAVGFNRGQVRRLVLREHVTLLWTGLGLGIVAALIAVVPALRPGSEMPWTTLGLTLLAVVANGFLWTWLATRFAMRGQLLDALRNQ